MTRYALEGKVTIGAPAEEVLRWLQEPELISRWMGVGSIETAGTGVRVDVLHGGYAGWSYEGEITESGADRLVRRYRFAGRGAEEYERTVTYELRPTGADGVELGITAVTLIPGLDERAARMGGKAEQRSLERALERLKDAVAGRGGGFLSRLRGSGGSAGPL
jgi:uncharacterized protein YndB with AHSA1/START domain